MKIEKNTNDKPGFVDTTNLSSIVNSLQNKIPKGFILFDKSLLPSHGKFYTETIYIKKLSTLNIKNLATVTEQNINFIVNGIISNCLYGIDANKILVGDKVWLIFYLRSITYNDLPYKLRGTCENCGGIRSYDYVLRNLDVTYLDKDLPESFKIGDDEVEIRFPTISTEGAVNKFKNDPNNMLDINPELLEFSSYVYKVNGEKLSIGQAYEYICNMEAMDFTKLTNELTEYIFSAKPLAKFTCPDCGETVYLPMAFTPAFFLPKI